MAGSKFCTGCGSVLKRGETLSTEELTQRQYQPGTPKIRKAPFSIALVVSALVVALMAVGATGYFFVLPLISDANYEAVEARHAPDIRERNDSAERENEEYYDPNEETSNDEQAYLPEPDDETPPEESYVPVESWMIALEDLLSQMTTIFEPPAWAEVRWNDDWTAEEFTGRYVLGWGENWVPITTYVRPDIFFIMNGGGFFDAFGNRINDAPWLISWHGSGWSMYNFASSFRLFDFGNNGIPDLVVHYSQTFEGGYGGATQVYRYVNGSFRRLENSGRLTSQHMLFVDVNGNIIAFINNAYFGDFYYAEVTLTNNRLDMREIVSMWDLGWEWEQWQDFHWLERSQDADGNWRLVDGWMFRNPTILGTNIPITPLEPLTSLQEEITANLRDR